ncbi:phosphopantetheine-binding protein [Sinorhizobium terangae]|uniref:phosphopantetheine-binding protein n=1 Tax=Sinorhizobium terangae TaxID=110322 RepID=UPI003630F15E
MREAVVVARDDRAGDKRLVAYVVAQTADGSHEADGAALAAALRAHLGGLLPDYMVPAAFVRLDVLPLTPNGKLDRKALPVPDDDAYGRRGYAAPQGAVETLLAAIWEELLGIERVGRHDNFFELGGHSLLAVQLMERLRRQSLGVEVRTLFARPVLCDLAASLGSHHEVVVPANRISEESTAITPQMLPLIDLTQEEIDRIVSTVPGGVGNIQDIYGLSPLQDGILFHHLLATEGDPLSAGQSDGLCRSRSAGPLPCGGATGGRPPRHPAHRLCLAGSVEPGPGGLAQGAIGCARGRARGL